MLTLERLREVLAYDPVAGTFTWRITMRGSKHRKAGCPAGSITRHGYTFISIDRRRYASHRLAWALMTGEFPVGDLDHADGDSGNNKWSNLRLATRSQNMANGPRRSDNKSGIKGVSWHAAKQNWFVFVSNTYVGSFKTLKEAQTARERAAKEAYGEFARD